MRHQAVRSPGCSLIIYGLLSLLVNPRLLAATEERHSEFALVRDGQPACSIVISEHPTPAARLASLEIQYHVLKISGSTLPIQTDAQIPPGNHILVGESAATRRLGLRSADFASQEYAAAFRTHDLVLIGRDWIDAPENRRREARPMTGDSLAELRHRVDFWKAVGIPGRSTGDMELPGLYDDQGTCLATYDFLERLCGVHWFGPGQTNLFTPARTDISVTTQSLRRSPGLKNRSALPAGNWPFLHGQWGEFTPAQLQLHWRRSRQGGLAWAANHTFHRATLQSVFTDPEYQSRNPKSAGSQLCYTHPKLIAKVAQMARDYFDGRATPPPGWKAAGDFFAIVPDDNMNLCNCTSCRELIHRGEGRKSGYFSDGRISDYWFTFVNAVAREVGRTHPRKYIATLAYWAYAQPPTFDLEPNVSVSPCLHTCYYPVHPGMRANDEQLYEQWKRKSHAPMFLWVYYHHPMEPALIERWKCFPHIMPHETARAMKQFVRDGIQGIFECGEQDQVEQYLINRLWDDPNLDVDFLIHEFFTDHFGSAAGPMEQFYLSLEAIASNAGNYPPPYLRDSGINWKRVAWESLGTQPRMQELGALVSQAGQLAATDLERTRVALWKKAIWDWMQEGAHAGNKP